MDIKNVTVKDLLDKVKNTAIWKLFLLGILIIVIMTKIFDFVLTQEIVGELKAFVGGVIQDYRESNEKEREFDRKFSDFKKDSNRHFDELMAATKERIDKTDELIKQRSDDMKSRSPIYIEGNK